MTFDIEDDFHIHPTVYIAAGARLYGKVTIGAHSSVWDGTVIRGDMAPVVIGEYTNIQENSVIHVGPGHPTRIGNYVTIGHNVVIDSATICDNCLIAIKAAVLKGGVVEENSIVGAGAIVMERKTIPAGSVAYGIPATVVKELTEAQRERNRMNAIVYMGMATRYREKQIHK